MSARGSASMGSSERRTVLKPLLTAQLLDVGGALEVARCEDEQRVRLHRAHSPERRQHRALFTFHRAAGDDHRPCGRNAEETQDALTRPGLNGRSRQVQRIELEAAGDGDAPRIRTQIDESPRRFFALDAEAVDVVQHRLHEGAYQPVARIGPLRQAPVDDGRLHAAHAALVQQVGPDLGLHHDEQPRPDQVERAADEDRKIEGEVEHFIHFLHVPSRDRLPRHGGRRQKDPEPWVTRTQVARQWPCREHFSDRDGVYPDGNAPPSMLNDTGR